MCFSFERQSVLWIDTHKILQKKDSSMFRTALLSSLVEKKTTAEQKTQIPPY